MAERSDDRQQAERMDLLMDERKKMDPETAIKVLKVLGDWILMQHAPTDNDKEAKQSLDEAIQIAVAALEEKIEL